MAGKSSGDRRKPIRKGKDGKNAAPAKAVKNAREMALLPYAGAGR